MTCAELRLRGMWPCLLAAAFRCTVAGTVYESRVLPYSPAFKPAPAIHVKEHLSLRAQFTIFPFNCKPSRHATENLRDLSPPVLEHFVEPPPNDQRIDNFAKKVERQSVFDDIGHLRPALDFAEPVRMMPQLVRPFELAILEEIGLRDPHDFSRPPHRNHHERIKHEVQTHPLVNRASRAPAIAPQKHLRRRDSREIVRHRKKIPGAVNTHRHLLHPGSGMKVHRIMASFK